MERPLSNVPTRVAVVLIGVGLALIGLALWQMWRSK
jgi:hypothetical protein